MFVYAPTIGRLHKDALKKNPRQRRAFARRAKQLFNRIPVRMNTSHTKINAFLIPKFQYPDIFIDDETGGPYPLYQECFISVYYSVEVAGDSNAFWKGVPIQFKDGRKVWLKQPKYNRDLWVDSEFAGEGNRNLHLGYARILQTKKGEEFIKYDKKIENMYIQYAVAGTAWNRVPLQEQGINLEAQEIAEEDVFDAYSKWFEENREKLSSLQPKLSLKEIIKPKYSRVRIEGQEFSVIDPVLNLWATIKSLKALQTLIQGDLKTWQVGVGQILTHPFYRQYERKINQSLIKKFGPGWGINLFPREEEGEVIEAPKTPTSFSPKLGRGEIPETASQDEQLKAILKAFVKTARATKQKMEEKGTEVPFSTERRFYKYLLLCCLGGKELFEAGPWRDTISDTKEWANKELAGSGLTIKTSIPNLKKAYQKTKELTAKETNAQAKLAREFATLWVEKVGEAFRANAKREDRKLYGEELAILKKLTATLAFKAILLVNAVSKPLGKVSDSEYERGLTYIRVDKEAEVRAAKEEEQRKEEKAHRRAALLVQQKKEEEKAMVEGIPSTVKWILQDANWETDEAIRGRKAVSKSGNWITDALILALPSLVKASASNEAAKRLSQPLKQVEAQWRSTYPATADRIPALKAYTKKMHSLIQVEMKKKLKGKTKSEEELVKLALARITAPLLFRAAYAVYLSLIQVGLDPKQIDQVGSFRRASKRAKKMEPLPPFPPMLNPRH